MKKCFEIFLLSVHARVLTSSENKSMHENFSLSLCTERCFQAATCVYNSEIHAPKTPIIDSFGATSSFHIWLNSSQRNVKLLNSRFNYSTSTERSFLWKSFCLPRVGKVFRVKALPVSVWEAKTSTLMVKSVRSARRQSFSQKSRTRFARLFDTKFI